MNTKTFFIYLIVMAGVTYLIRAIPLTAFSGKIENRFIKSFLAYVPYAVLGAMTFPAIINATHSPIAGIAAFAAGLVAAWFNAGLFKVSCVCCAVVFILEFFV